MFWLWIVVYVLVGALWVPTQLWMLFTIPLIQLTDETSIGGVYGSLKKLKNRELPKDAWVCFSIVWPLYVCGSVLLGCTALFMRTYLLVRYAVAKKPKPKQPFGKRNLKATPK